MDNYSGNSRLDGVDCLRGIAIIAVVVYHFLYRFDPEYLLYAGHGLGKAPLWLGVDLFFIVSGFCIAFTLARSGTLSAFLAARFARIQPAYMAAVAVTFAVVAWAGLPGREASALEALGNLLWFNAVGAVRHVDGVYWSLVVELKFYVLVGALWAVAPSGRALTLAWAVLCLASVGMLKIHAGAAHQLLLYPFNAFFLVGIALFNMRSLSAGELLLCGATVALCVATASRYEGVWLEAAGVMALACALVHVRRMTGFRWLAGIGVVSYSWYLLHQNIGLVVIRAINAEGFTAIAIPTAIVATLAAAFVFHALFETSARRPMERLALGALRLLRVDEMATRVNAAATTAINGLTTRLAGGGDGDARGARGVSRRFLTKFSAEANVSGATVQREQAHGVGSALRAALR